MITYYSKKDCKPCEIEFEKFRKKFKETDYKKVVLQTNEEALETVTKYGVRTVPFLIIGEKTVIPTNDLVRLLRCLN
jgi:glutaredoxin